MSFPPNAACPCHSGRKYKKCCRPWHEGAPAPTPTELMRSRYAAYAMGLTAHILRTTDPAGPHWEADANTWTEGVRAFSQQTAFEGLEILEAHTEGDAGTVRFAAHLRSADGPTVMVEHSRFVRIKGRWLYHDGTHA